MEKIRIFIWIYSDKLVLCYKKSLDSKIDNGCLGTCSSQSKVSLSAISSQGNSSRDKLNKIESKIVNGCLATCSSQSKVSLWAISLSGKSSGDSSIRLDRK